MVDARFIKSREAERLVGRAALIVSGVRADEFREILGVRLGDTESFANWDKTFDWLKKRGLAGVMVIVSDEHGGLKQAIAKHFQGASWQRCQVHRMRNLLGSCSVKIRAEIAAAVKRVFQAADLPEVRCRLAKFSERFAKRTPHAVACLEAGFEDAKAVMTLPDEVSQAVQDDEHTEAPERRNPPP